MHDIFTLFLHAIVTIIRLGKPGGLRSVVAESVLMRHQLLILNRGRKRASNLQPSDGIIAGLCTLFMRPIRVLRSPIVFLILDVIKGPSSASTSKTGEHLF